MKELKLFNLAIPIFIETALFMLLGFIDVFILSQYDDLAASAVNTANQAVSIITVVFTVICGASGILISQYLGADKRKDASRISAAAISLNFVFGVAISFIFVFFGDNILGLTGAKGDLMDLASQYLGIVGGFIFMQAVLSSMSVIIRNHGLTKISMYVTVGMNIINLILDIIFVQSHSWYDLQLFRLKGAP